MSKFNEDWHDNSGAGRDGLSRTLVSHNFLNADVRFLSAHVISVASLSATILIAWRILTQMPQRHLLVI